MNDQTIAILMACVIFILVVYSVVSYRQKLKLKRATEKLNKYYHEERDRRVTQAMAINELRQNVSSLSNRLNVITEKERRTSQIVRTLARDLSLAGIFVKKP